MRLFCSCVMILLVTSGTAQAAGKSAWKAFSSYSGATVYYNERTIVPLPRNRARITIKTVFPKTEKRAAFMTNLVEYDCESRKSRFMRDTLRLRNGKDVHGKKPGGWQSIDLSDPAQARLFKAACRQPAP